MNDDLSLRVLAQIMGWDHDRAGEEYRWLKFISSLKYDGYRDFQAGMRFSSRRTNGKRPTRSSAVAWSLSA